MSETTYRAAQYIRMSTDSQDLSPEMQRAAIESYAQAKGLSVVETYLDAGKSGLTLAKRPAMKRLLADVAGGRCGFSTVLVYDISRWGRFQDTDASAYYEYHCRLHGVEVRYVQEPFGLADSPISTLYKSFKRLMAAEYSRELAVKTSAGQSLAIAQGFQLGTLPCLGISRLAVSKADGSERLLGPTDHKSARGEHVRWIPGPEQEVHTVQRIFRLYAGTEMSVTKIARLLRDEGTCARNGRPITEWMLYRLLRCEALTGDFVWGREEHKKRRPAGDARVRRKMGIMQPIVARALFDAVQAKLAHRAHVNLTRDLLVARLREALQRNPRLTASALKAHGCPCRETYRKAFGSLQSAWEAAGFPQHVADHQDHQATAAELKVGARLCRTLASLLRDAGVECSFHRRADRNAQTLLLNGDTVLRTQVIRRRPRYQGTQWALRKIYKGWFDWALVVRLNADDSVFDSFLVSRAQYFALDRWLQDSLPGTWSLHGDWPALVDLMRSIRPAPRKPQQSIKTTPHVGQQRLSEAACGDARQLRTMLARAAQPDAAGTTTSHPE